jgi:soluble lytic murein transglycosylase-like protein
MSPRAIIAAAVCLAIAPAVARAQPACSDMSRSERRAQLTPILDAAAYAHGLDPALLAAIAEAESDDCAEAVSPKGAAGLMQLMPATADRFGVWDPFDPAQNALGAARFLDYLSRYSAANHMGLAQIIAAYNAGEGAVTSHGGIPPYRETQEYVRRVIWLYLLGYVPASERDREAKINEAATHQSRVAAKPQHHVDSDTAILDQLATLRQSRSISH